DLKTEFSSMLGFVRKNYPWLRPMNAYDGYRAMEEFDDIGADFKFAENDLLVQSGAPGLIFRMRFEGKTIQSITGGTLLYSYKSMDAAVIKADGPEVRVRFR
ncbi:MAG: hypothetical protein KAH95_08915, partial [Spirochaetales bacterium]|nr:hypothetical protein [Spirochaetales bacterium]